MAKAKRKLDWRFNASTGASIADLNRNTRLVTDGPNPVGRLYRCEFWGDYSLKYPIKGPWSKSVPKAIASCAALKKKGR